MRATTPAWGSRARHVLAGVTIAAVCWAGPAAARAVPRALAAQTPGALVDRVMATVGGAIVTWSDVQAARALGLLGVAGDARDDEVVTRLVDHEIVRLEVERFRPAEPDARIIEARLSAVARRAGSAERLQTMLRGFAFSDTRLRAFVREEVRAEQYLDARFAAAAAPTDEEVRRYFFEHGEEFAVGGDVPPFDDVQADVRARATRVRRDALVEQWLEGLRRRSDIRRPSPPPERDPAAVR
ncbi:MAG: hypothetical protein U0Q12_21840 [Vicinamibacterales bacterium]